LKDLELQGVFLLTDVPEHIRPASIWTLLRKPWSYWRYPLGVLTAVKQYLYNPRVDPPEVSSCSSDFQIKMGLRRPFAHDTGAPAESGSDVEARGLSERGSSGTDGTA
jgi:hypothetical protein